MVILVHNSTLSYREAMLRRVLRGVHGERERRERLGLHAPFCSRESLSQYSATATKSRKPGPMDSACKAGTSLRKDGWAHLVPRPVELVVVREHGPKDLLPPNEMVNRARAEGQARNNAAPVFVVPPEIEP